MYHALNGKKTKKVSKKIRMDQKNLFFSYIIELAPEEYLLLLANKLSMLLFQ